VAWLGWDVLQLALAVGNGVGSQASDLGEGGDAAWAVLLRQEADEQPPDALIGGSDQTVDPLVLVSAGAMGMLYAGRTGAYVDDTLGMLLGHQTVPPWAGRERANIILADNHSSNF
jgi:hypothetical protein